MKKKNFHPQASTNPAVKLLATGKTTRKLASRAEDVVVRQGGKPVVRVHAATGGRKK